MSSYCNCNTCQTKHRKGLDLISSYLVGTSTSTLCKGVPTSCPSLTSFSDDGGGNRKNNNSKTRDNASDDTYQQMKTKKTTNKTKSMQSKRTYPIVRTDGKLVENRPIVIPIFKDNDNDERTIVYDPINIGSGVVLSHAARHVFDELLAEHIFSIILESATGMEATVNIKERLSLYTLWYCANQAVCSLFEFLVSSANIYTYSDKIATTGLRVLLSSAASDASSLTFPSSITDHELTECMVPVYPYDSRDLQPNINRRKTSKILYSRINIPKPMERYVRYVSYFISLDASSESSKMIIQKDMQLGMIPCWSGVFFCPPKCNKRRTRKRRIFADNKCNINRTNNFMKRLLSKKIFVSLIEVVALDKSNHKKDLNKTKKGVCFAD